MNPSDSQESHEEHNSSVVNLGLSLWCRAIFPAHILIFAVVWVCYPAYGWQAWSRIYFAFILWFIQLRLQQVLQTATDPQERRFVRGAARGMVWLWLGLVTMPLLVLLVIFGPFKMWPPH